MKNLLSIVVLSLLLTSCATTSSNIEQNKIKIGIDKSEFCYEAGTMSAKKDPCRLTYSEMLNAKPRGAYYPDTKMEIMHNLTSEKYYVFENVTIQHATTASSTPSVFMSHTRNEVPSKASARLANSCFLEQYLDMFSGLEHSAFGSN